MLNQVFIFATALFMVIKGATLATRYATALAQAYHLSKYTVGFIIIAIISILPETFISINAALSGIPSFGLGVLFGSNIADLTLIIALILFLVGRGIKIESKILKNYTVYPFILLLPLILGANGHFSRIEGTTLIIIGGIFYYLAFRQGSYTGPIVKQSIGEKAKNVGLLLASMALLLVGAHFTVTAATALATSIGVSPIIIGMLIVGLGTTMPEFFFSLKSLKRNDDSLAVGDILGTVLADATIVVGILALVRPFSFPQKIVFVTGMFMVIASFLLFYFMRSGRKISKQEAHILFFFWVTFVLVEFFVNR